MVTRGRRWHECKRRILFFILYTLWQVQVGRKFSTVPPLALNEPESSCSVSTLRCSLRGGGAGHEAEHDDEGELHVCVERCG